MGDLAFLGLCPESFRISLCAGVLCALHFAKNSQGLGRQSRGNLCMRWIFNRVAYNVEAFATAHRGVVEYVYRE